MFQSALPFRDETGYDRARERLEEGNAFLYHLAEGSDPKLIAEYDDVRDHGLLAPGFVGIHTNALHDPHYQEWAPRGGSVVWSPFSNLWLYGQTTDVLAARQAGLNVSLGADWSPSGSKNLLGELKVADLYNTTRLDGVLSAQELCEMATANPADALGWQERLGRLRPGLHGDVLVTTDRGGDPYRNLIESTERDVLFVAINGIPFYGTTKLMRAAAAQHAEPISVGRLRRSIVLVYPGIQDADMSWAQVIEDLRLVRRDPEAARRRAEAVADQRGPSRPDHQHLRPRERRLGACHGEARHASLAPDDRPRAGQPAGRVRVDPPRVGGQRLTSVPDAYRVGKASTSMPRPSADGLGRLTCLRRLPSPSVHLPRCRVRWGIGMGLGVLCCIGAGRGCRRRSATMPFAVLPTPGTVLGDRSHPRRASYGNRASGRTCRSRMPTSQSRSSLHDS